MDAHTMTFYQMVTHLIVCKCDEMSFILDTSKTSIVKQWKSAAISFNYEAGCINGEVTITGNLTLCNHDYEENEHYDIIIIVDKKKDIIDWHIENRYNPEFNVPTQEEVLGAFFTP